MQLIMMSVWYDVYTRKNHLNKCGITNAGKHIFFSDVLADVLTLKLLFTHEQNTN